MIAGLKSRLLTGALILMLAPAAPAADIAAGKATYALCVVCHGADGEGNAAMQAPMLAGQEAWYLKRQLENFRRGLRGAADGDSYGAQMRPIAQVIDAFPTEADLIAYIVSLPSQTAKPAIVGDASAGKAVYAACATCHGRNAEGNEQLAAPRLAGRDDWYLARQLDNYRIGRRGYDREDVFGMQMRAMAATLAGDQAVNDVVAFIATLK
ncbi:MAG: cytochrome c [Steroidobacteraceae bacterium]